MIFYKCYGNHDKNKDIDVDKLPEKERKYYVYRKSYWNRGKDC